MREVEAMCDRIVFLHNGRIAAQGTASELSATYGQADLEGVFLHVTRAGGAS
jgi:ABC-2 type transport system ATP-binding protein